VLHEQHGGVLAGPDLVGQAAQVLEREPHRAGQRVGGGAVAVAASVGAQQVGERVARARRGEQRVEVDLREPTVGRAVV
jgi:hypothetical protein